MKLKYKKMVIIASIVVMALGFVALVFLDNGSPNQNAQTADLNLNENKDINKLIENYFNAKKSVNMDALSELVSDPSRIPKDRYTILASYVENYKCVFQNFPYIRRKQAQKFPLLLFFLWRNNILLSSCPFHLHHLLSLYI